MFDWIRTILEELHAARQVRANVALLDGLSDRTLADLGIERCDVEQVARRYGRKPRGGRRLELLYRNQFVPRA